MRYEIFNEQINLTVKNLRLNTIPQNEVLESFFSQVKLTDYPELIEYVSQSISWGQEFVSIRFYAEMDWEDRAVLDNIGGIKVGEVAVYHQIINQYTVVPDSFFRKILYDYGIKLLEVYGNDLTLPEKWSFKMEEGVTKLYNL